MATGRQKLELAERRERVAALLKQGMAQTEIARTLGCHPSQITRDLQSLRGRAHVAATTDVTSARDVELARLDAIDASAVEHFEAAPSPAWLRVRVAVSARRAALLSLDGAAVVELRAEVTSVDAQRPEERRAAVVRRMLEKALDNGISLRDAAEGLEAMGVEREDIENAYGTMAADDASAADDAADLARRIAPAPEVSPAPDIAPDDAADDGPLPPAPEPPADDAADTS